VCIQGLSVALNRRVNSSLDLLFCDPLIDNTTTLQFWPLCMPVCRIKEPKRPHIMDNYGAWLGLLTHSYVCQEKI